jgi:hypothetical protein
MLIFHGEKNTKTSTEIEWLVGCTTHTKNNLSRTQKAHNEDAKFITVCREKKIPLYI